MFDIVKGLAIFALIVAFVAAIPAYIVFMAYSATILENPGSSWSPLRIVLRRFELCFVVVIVCMISAPLLLTPGGSFVSRVGIYVPLFSSSAYFLNLVHQLAKVVGANGRALVLLSILFPPITFLIVFMSIRRKVCRIVAQEKRSDSITAESRG